MHGEKMGVKMSVGKSMVHSMLKTSDINHPNCTARSMRRAQQTQDILEAMARNDYDQLKKLARHPEGFVDDKLRQYVW